ncbi:MAG: tetratricopeptide repeat protein [Candidatus Hodarchaeota archaeon]
MRIPQELLNLQSSLSQAFDRIGITQEIKNDLSLDDFSPQELDQLSFLIEKFESNLSEIRYNPEYNVESLDQRLLIRLGNYYFFQGDTFQAIEYYDLSNQIEENEWAHYNSAFILEKQGQFERAYEKFDQAIKLKPDFPQAFRHQAMILTSQGKAEKAIDKLLKSRELNPSDPDTNKLLAKYYIEHGEKKEALTHLKAIHHRDSSVSNQIEELEKEKTFLGRITNLFRKKN